MSAFSETVETTMIPLLLAFHLLLKTEYEKRLDYAVKNTSLPVHPNMKRIEEFVISVNERVVKNEI